MSTRRTAPVDVPCPVGKAAGLVGDRWTLLILRNAMVGTTRFDGFRAELGIADNILSNRLGRLVEAGLLVKLPYRNGGRTRHEYRLTQAGADIVPVLNALAQWAVRHATDGLDADNPMRVLHEVCGQDLTGGDFCDHCERHVPREEMLWLRPWRSTEPYTLAEPTDTPADPVET